MLYLNVFNNNLSYLVIFHVLRCFFYVFTFYLVFKFSMYFVFKFSMYLVFKFSCDVFKVSYSSSLVLDFEEEGEGEGKGERGNGSVVIKLQYQRTSPVLYPHLVDSTIHK